MAKRLLESYFKNSEMAGNVARDVAEALSRRDPAGLVAQINKLLAALPYDYYQTDPRDEYFYCSNFFSLFYALALDCRSEEHARFGRSDFFLECGGQAWAVEVKVSHAGQDDSERAKDALAQILKKDYAKKRKNPVLLGLAVNDEARQIKSWECAGGLAARPESETEPAKPGKDDGEPARPAMKP